MHPILIHFGPWTFTVPYFVIGALIGAIVGLVTSSSQDWPFRRALAAVLGGLGAGAILALIFEGTGGHTVEAWEPKIHTFGPLVALGAFIAIIYMRREGKRRGLDPELLTGYAVEVLLAGVVGSRILFCLVTPEAFPILKERSFFENYILQYVALWNGGLVWYGGILFAWPVVVFRAAHLGLPWRTVCDIVAPTIMIGLAVGRIGCLMAGDDHGRIVESGEHWWTITFTDKDALVAPACLGRPLYPSQPHMGWGALACAVVSHYAGLRFRNRPGAGALVLGIVYPLHRFGVEFFRGDTVRKFIPIPGITKYDPDTGQALSGLSTSQAISIPIVLLAVGFLIWVLRSRPRGVERVPLEAADPLVKEAATNPGSPATSRLARIPGGLSFVLFLYVGLEVGVVIARRLELAGAFDPVYGYVLFPAICAAVVVFAEWLYRRSHPSGLLAPADALLMPLPMKSEPAPPTAATVVSPTVVSPTVVSPTPTAPTVVSPMPTASTPTPPSAPAPGTENLAPAPPSGENAR